MYISLPGQSAPAVSGNNGRRRPPLTPASLSQPHVSTNYSPAMQCDRSNSQRSASQVLSRVASSPGSPTLSSANTTALPTPNSAPSNGSSPASTPGGSSNHFPFCLQKQLNSLYDAPASQYVSFPSFEDTYGEYSDEEDNKKQ